MLGRLLGLGKRKSLRMFAGTFMAGALARLMLLGMTIILARQFAPEEYGGFILATGIASLAANVSGLGWPSLSSRLIPTFSIGGQWASLRGLLRWGDLMTLLGALALMGVVALIALLPGLDAGVRSSISLALVLLLPASLGYIRRSQLAGAQKAAWGISFDQTLPALTVVLVAWWVGIPDAATAVMVLAGATCVGWLCGTWRLRVALPQAWQVRPNVQLWAWITAALPLVVGTSSKLIMDRMDVLMLGPLAGLEQVGLFGGAYRISYILTFPQVMIMTVITPLLAGSLARGELATMWRQFRGALIFSTVTTIPIAIALIVYSDWVTVILGAGYAGSTTPLSIMAVAQGFAALSIPCAGLLIASGQGKMFGALNFAAVLLNGAVNFLLIPPLGATGAAMATAVSTLLIFLGQAALIVRYQHLIGTGPVELHPIAGVPPVV